MPLVARARIPRNVAGNPTNMIAMMVSLSMEIDHSCPSIGITTLCAKITLQTLTKRIEKNAMTRMGAVADLMMLITVDHAAFYLCSTRRAKNTNSDTTTMVAISRVESDKSTVVSVKSISKMFLPMVRSAF